MERGRTGIELGETRRTRRGSGLRFDIQAVRALAVGLVVLYHVDERLVPGGFIGVDVFFAVSGYLITMHIVDTVTEPGAFSLRSFYVRRIRRLLPASILVLACTLAGTIAFAPKTLWIDFGRQIAASAFYAQNWILARDAVDYSAIAADASPVQHFWSLSTEEQFYLVWPLLILGAVLLARKTARRPRAVIGGVLAAVVVASLVHSILYTASDPAAAYFITPTRAWEFGLGGLFAVLWRESSLGVGARVASTWAGLALILFSAFAFSASTPFPSAFAAVPVAGTLLIIAGSDVTGRLSPAILLRTRPVQYLGDISYSVYLWHWPLLVLLPMALPGSGRLVVIALAAVLTILLAALTKRFVEDRFRSPRPPRTGAVVRAPRTLARTFVATAAGMVLIAAPALAASASAGTEIETARADLAAALADPPEGFGAASAPDSSIRVVPEILPAPVLAASDGLQPLADGTVCQDRADIVVPTGCRYGSDSPSAVRVALVGDSHAGHWVPALRAVALERGWSLTVYARSSCPFSAADTIAAAANGGACGRWKSAVMADLEKGDFAAVFVSALSSTPYEAAGTSESNTAVTGFVTTWEAVERLGSEVVVLRDNPDPTADGLADVPSCVEMHPDAIDDCSSDRDVAVLPDPQVEAADRAGATVLDLTSAFCDDIGCPAVVGGVLVYRDKHHITETFSASLAPVLSTELAGRVPDLG